MAVGPYGALLDAVRGVRWPARRAVPGGSPGSHRARTRGIAPEFAEYRPYRQGDDPRRLDWKLLGRSDKAFIRLAPDHAILGTTFIVDASASMAFEGKWETAKRLVVALAAVAHAAADPVGLIVATTQGVRRLAPRARAGVVAEIARTLDDIVPMESAPLAPLVTQSTSRCVVLTDCLGDLDELRAALARHWARGGESHLLHIVSRREIEPSSDSMMAVDPEDTALERPLVATSRAGYIENFAAWRGEVASAARGAGIAYQEIVDDQPAEATVRRIVAPTAGERPR